MPAAMTAIERTGQLEAQREIIQNQNLIAKPDSVLEYSCFEQHLTLSGAQTGPLFSEQEGFFGINDPFIDPNSLDRAIYYLTFEALIEYLQANFWHKYLGDRSSLVGLPPAGGAGYSCYAMGYVWNKAKCLDFIGENRYDQDSFYTFEDYMNMANDPRDLPDPQQCAKWADWSTAITDSTGLNAPTTGVISSAMMDPLTMYPALFDPAACAPPIPTGVVVPPMPGLNTPTPRYDEYMCVTPGCHYDGSNCVP